MKRIVLASCLAASLLGGCYHIRYDADALPDGSVSLTQAPEGKIRRHFAVEQHGVWLSAGLLPISSPNVAEALRVQAEGRALQHVRFQSDMTVVDGLLTFGSGLILTVLVNAALPLSPTDPKAAATTLTFANALVALLTPNFRTITIEGDVLDRPGTGVPPTAPSPSARPR